MSSTRRPWAYEVLEFYDGSCFRLQTSKCNSCFLCFHFCPQTFLRHRKEVDATLQKHTQAQSKQACPSQHRLIGHVIATPQDLSVQSARIDGDKTTTRPAHPRLDGEDTEALFCVASTVDGIIVANEHHTFNCKSGSCFELCMPPRAPPSQCWGEVLFKRVAELHIKDPPLRGLE